MRRRLERLTAPALLLLIAACAADSRQAEIACQQRLVNVPAHAKADEARPGEGVMASTFARLSKGYSEMSLDGCTEDQVYKAGLLSRLARKLADTGDAAESAREGPPSLKGGEALMAFMAELERFEGLRGRVRDDLAEMTENEAQSR